MRFAYYVILPPSGGGENPELPEVIKEADGANPPGNPQHEVVSTSTYH